MQIRMHIDMHMHMHMHMHRIITHLLLVLCLSFLPSLPLSLSQATTAKAGMADAKKPLERVRKNDLQFTVHHYADSVTYDATGWVEKNKDALHCK